MSKLTRKDVGKWIKFTGFDGKEYSGLIASMKRQIATIEYTPTFGGRICLAYLEPKDHGRVIFTWR